MEGGGGLEIRKWNLLDFYIKKFAIASISMCFFVLLMVRLMIIIIIIIVIINSLVV
jgi:hypothetical protein